MSQIHFCGQWMEAQFCFIVKKTCNCKRTFHDKKSKMSHLSQLWHFLLYIFFLLYIYFIRQSLKKQTLCDKQPNNVSIMAYRVTNMKNSRNYNKWSSNYLYKYKLKVLFTSTYSTILYETGHHIIWVEVPFHLINDQNKQYSQTQVK